MTRKSSWVLLGLLAMVAGPVLAEESIGVVKRSKGQVLIDRGGAILRAAAGGELFKGDRVMTGQDGHVSISMRRAAPLTVGPVANVALDRFAADTRPVVRRPAPPILQGLASFVGIHRQR